MLTQPADTTIAITEDALPRTAEKSSLRVYSDVLQLRDDTLHKLLTSRQGIVRALRLFLVVTLIAGLGVFLGLPAALRQPTLPETIDQATGAIQQTGDFISDTIAPVIASGRIQQLPSELPSVIAGSVQQRLSEVTGVVSGVLAGAANPGERVEDLLGQTGDVTLDQINRAVQRSPVTPEQLSALLARANLSDEQVDALLSQTSVTRAQLDEAREQTGAAVDAATARLQPVLQSVNMTAEQLREILVELDLTPQQLDALLARFAAAPDQVAEVLKQAEVTPEQLRKFAADLRVEAVRLEPPIGARASRIVNLVGQWLSTPLRVAASAALFALALLLVARALGGRATLPQHVAAVALAAAPMVLAALDFAPPDLSGGMSAPLAVAIRLFGRVLALIALIWAGVILVKSLSVAHGFSMWRSAGAVALTALVVNVLAPLAGVLAAGFVLRP